MAEVTVNVKIECASEIATELFFKYLKNKMDDNRDYGSISSAASTISVTDSVFLSDESMLVKITEEFSEYYPEASFLMTGTITQHSPSWATMDFEIKYETGQMSKIFGEWNEDYEMDDEECECECCGTITDKEFAYIVKNSNGNILYFCEQGCFEGYLDENEFDEDEFEVVSEGF